MRGYRVSRLLSMSSLMVAMLVTTSCEEDVVFRDRVLFDDPPAAAGDFLGYSDVEARETVCGNCHVGQQAEWILTGHADAWETLENSGHAAAFCEDCHSITENGNAVEGSVGHNATGDERYYDVQCESCHGPGLPHVLNPDASQPLASIKASADATNGCGECHSGAHHPFVEEWAESGHGTAIAYPAGRPECQSCHRGQNALLAFGETAEYIEKDSAAHMPIVCAVCHDPHGGAADPEDQHAGQLRFPVYNAPSVEEHLCAQCHDRRSVPSNTSATGLHPHSPESALLEGTAGWWAPGSELSEDVIRGTHGSAANPGLCATCHVVSFSATDALTGEEVFTTGHSFAPIPCVGASGEPLSGQAAENCDYAVSARNWQGCTGSGCHGDATAARSALVSQVNTVRGLAEDLHAMLLIVDPNLETNGGEIDGSSPVFTVAEGAYFNYNLAIHYGEDNTADPSIGEYAATTVHNPFLIETLLQSSIDAVSDRYGVAQPSTRR
ncbi:MAG TPA: multiheme c-type cytochrome [Longimicrobiales bacterium]